MPKLKRITSACYLLSLSLLGCAELPVSKPSTPPLKNIILIIGDGMGPQQVGLLLSYAKQAPHGIITQHRTALDRILNKGQLGISMTHAANTLVTDSAASATQLAIGKAAGSEMIGLDQDGNPQQNIVELAKHLGKATGLVSDTRITHATPAAFAAHQSHRSQETDIAEDLLAAEPDVMLSGGLDYWVPQHANDPTSAINAQLSQLVEHNFVIHSARHDDKNLLYSAQQKGYTLAFNKTQLNNARGKTLGLFAGSDMADGIEESQYKNDPKRTEPSLKEMSEQALNILEKHQQGFFLMIESGQIDWACHHNDTGLLLHEMLRFNDTVNAVLDWAAKRNDTLIVVTADHETGGFGFSYSSANIPEAKKLPNNTVFKPNYNFGNPAVLDDLYAQQRSYHAIFKEFNSLETKQQTPLKLSELVNQYTAFKITATQAAAILKTKTNPAYKADANVSEKNAKNTPVMPNNEDFFVNGLENRENLLAQTVSAQQNAVWATGTHTSTPVYVFAAGPSSILDRFNKIGHHTELGANLMKTLRCSNKNAACNASHRTSKIESLPPLRPDVENQGFVDPIFK